MSCNSSTNDDSGDNTQLIKSEAATSFSPSHLVMTGPEFSAQELQELLGGVLGDAHPGAQQAYLSAFHEGVDGGGGVGMSGSVGGEDKSVARTERKRSREKQRRCNVNRQFTDLTTVVRRIESEAEELRAPTLYSPSNRADLIARTVTLLDQLHESNKRRKLEVTDLQEELQQARKSGEEAAAKLKESVMAPHNLGGNRVVMMVPMMLGTDGNPSQPMVPYGQGMQFMMPQEQQQAPSRAQYPPQEAAGTNVMGVSSPWGSMPQWMMQNMVMPPADLSPNIDMGNNEKKASPDSSSASIGSNLAHCA